MGRVGREKSAYFTTDPRTNTMSILHAPLVCLALLSLVPVFFAEMSKHYLRSISGLFICVLVLGSLRCSFKLDIS